MFRVSQRNQQEKEWPRVQNEEIDNSLKENSFFWESQLACIRWSSSVPWKEIPLILRSCENHPSAVDEVLGYLYDRLWDRGTWKRGKKRRGNVVHLDGSVKAKNRKKILKRENEKAKSEHRLNQFLVYNVRKQTIEIGLLGPHKFEIIERRRYQ